MSHCCPAVAVLIREPSQKDAQLWSRHPSLRKSVIPRLFSLAVADNMGPRSRRTIWICFLQINPPRLLEVLLLSPSDSGSFTDWRISQDTPSTNSHIRMLTSPVGASNLEASPKPRGGTVSPFRVAESEGTLPGLPSFSGPESSVLCPST